MRSLALILTLALLVAFPATAQQPTFNPATFDWTDPANWSTTIDPSAPTQTEGTGSLVSFARMSRAGLVQTKGFGSRLCSLR